MEKIWILSNPSWRMSGWQKSSQLKKREKYLHWPGSRISIFEDYVFKPFYAVDLDTLSLGWLLRFQPISLWSFSINSSWMALIILPLYSATWNFPFLRSPLSVTISQMLIMNYDRTRVSFLSTYWSPTLHHHTCYSMLFISFFSYIAPSPSCIP